MAILKIRNKEGQMISVPVIKGEKGDKGDPGSSNIHVGSGDMPPGCNIQIDPNGECDLPNYIITEANDVIDKVIEAQKGRTFTFAAITDLHYGGYYDGIADYTNSVNHACQALKYIDERVKLDAVAVLGDYTDGTASELTQYNTAIFDFKGVNSVLDKLRFAPNLRLQGNHDFMAEKSPLTHRFIGAFTDENVEWGNYLGSYFYKDFKNQKLRVICLNTSELDGDALSCSDEQYQWFINSLDMSNKESGWQILILSHIPVDLWPGAGDKYKFGPILKAYQEGKTAEDIVSELPSVLSNSLDGLSVDFSGGKNSAKIVGNIHGHVHNFRMDKICIDNVQKPDAERLNIWRIATPNACFGAENKDTYEVYYQEDVTYTKTANTAYDTSFCIYCINLDDYTIKAICYGAGCDRTLDYLNGTIDIVNKPDVIIPKPDEPSTYVNALTISRDLDGNIYNEDVTPGYKVNTRWSGSNSTEESYSNIYLSGYIPYDGKAGTVYLKNVSTADRLTVWYFKEDSMTKHSLKRELSAGTITECVYGDDGNVISFKLEADCNYIRIECSGFTADSKVSINYEIPDDNPDEGDNESGGNSSSNIINVLDTVGYVENTRFSTSSGSLSPNEGTHTTGKFTVSAGDTIYLKNVGLPDGVTDAYPSRVCSWTSDGTYYNYFQLNKYLDSEYGVVSENGNIVQFKVLESYLGGTTGQIAICVGSIGADSIITVNQPIK